MKEIGILGRWEYSDETINGMSDLLPKCCNFFEFVSDANKDDFIGLFTYTDDENEFTEGVFLLDLSDQIITFNLDDNEQIIYNYSLNQSQDYMSLSFTEGALSYVQGWVKVD